MSVGLANNIQTSINVAMVSIGPNMALGATSPQHSSTSPPGMVLSPNKIKIEPKFVQSPCNIIENGSSVGYRPKQSNDHWMQSPSALSPNSHGLSHINGHSGSMSIGTNGFSPLSSSSYETFSPNGKEEMSPPNGYTQIDSYNDSKIKKKGPAPRQQEELCLVCGDRASGYHYNALTCEGCKGFFRRSITKDAVYQCKYGNNCEIDMYMRRKCQQCRLRKCLAVGMRPECVVPEAQCAMKRESKRAQKEKDKPNSTTREYISEPHKEISSPIVVQNIRPPPPPPTIDHTKSISPEQEELINRLVYFQEEFESPSDEDLKTVTEFPLGDRSEDADMRLKHVTEITILTVQLIVEFSKRLPGFDTLLREDQITLLKACSSEVMMLRCARKYDINTDSIVFANNQPYTRENYFSASVGDSADAIFSFCKHLCLMKVDNAEFALLTALVIFSERPSLVEPKKVEKIQEIYVDALKTYINNHAMKQAQKFARLLAVLTELRSLGNANLEMCFSLKVKNKNLPAFLAEIWDIQT